MVTVSSNVVLFPSLAIVGGAIAWRRPPCIRVLTTRGRAAAPRRPRARRTFFRATPRPETGTDSSVSSSISAVVDGSSSGTSAAEK